MSVRRKGKGCIRSKRGRIAVWMHKLSFRNALHEQKGFKKPTSPDLQPLFSFNEAPFSLRNARGLGPHR